MSKYRAFTLFMFVVMLGITATVFANMTVSRDSKEAIIEEADILVHSTDFVSRQVQMLDDGSGFDAATLEKLNKIKEENDDVYGWLTIEDFDIDYPVMKTDDNKVYLRRDIYGNYSVAGAIYLDSNYQDNLSPMKLIHGHNMKNGTMFSKVPSLLHSETLDDAPLIIFTDEQGTKTFKIFSVFSVNAKEESVIIEPYRTEPELEELKKYYIERSWVPVTEVPNSVEMLMLNTCWYGESGHERFLHCIVVAARV